MGLARNKAGKTLPHFTAWQTEELTEGRQRRQLSVPFTILVELLYLVFIRNTKAYPISLFISSSQLKYADDVVVNRFCAHVSSLSRRVLFIWRVIWVILCKLSYFRLVCIFTFVSTEINQTVNRPWNTHQKEVENHCKVVPKGAWDLDGDDKYYIRHLSWSYIYV